MFIASLLWQPSLCEALPNKPPRTSSLTWSISTLSNVEADWGTLWISFWRLALELTSHGVISTYLKWANEVQGSHRSQSRRGREHSPKSDRTRHHYCRVFRAQIDRDQCGWHLCSVGILLWRRRSEHESKSPTKQDNFRWQLGCYGRAWLSETVTGKTIIYLFSFVLRSLWLSCASVVWHYFSYDNSQQLWILVWISQCRCWRFEFCMESFTVEGRISNTVKVTEIFCQPA